MKRNPATKKVNKFRLNCDERPYYDADAPRQGSLSGRCLANLMQHKLSQIGKTSQIQQIVTSIIYNHLSTVYCKQWGVKIGTLQTSLFSRALERNHMPAMPGRTPGNRNRSQSLLCQSKGHYGLCHAYKPILSKHVVGKSGTNLFWSLRVFFSMIHVFCDCGFPGEPHVAQGGIRYASRSARGNVMWIRPRTTIDADMDIDWYWCGFRVHVQYRYSIGLEWYAVDMKENARRNPMQNLNHPTFGTKTLRTLTLFWPQSGSDTANNDLLLYITNNMLRRSQACINEKWRNAVQFT